MPTNIISILFFIVGLYLLLAILLLIHILIKKRDTGRVLLVNAITANIVVVLCLLSFLLNEESLLDMAIMCILLGSICGGGFSLYKRIVGLKNNQK